MRRPAEADATLSYYKQVPSGKDTPSAVYIHNIEFHPNPRAWFGADEFSGESWHIVIAIHD
jgi:hypothetical protein